MEQKPQRLQKHASFHKAKGMLAFSQAIMDKLQAAEQQSRMVQTPVTPQPTPQQAPTQIQRPV